MIALYLSLVLTVRSILLSIKRVPMGRFVMGERTAPDSD